jgi:hypothetical protein
MTTEVERVDCRPWRSGAQLFRCCRATLGQTGFPSAGTRRVMVINNKWRCSSGLSNSVTGETNNTCKAATWRCLAASSNHSDASAVLQARCVIDEQPPQQQHRPAVMCTAAANELANAVLSGRKRPHRLNHHGVECSLDVEVVFGGVEARKGEADGGTGMALGCCLLHERVAVLRLERRPAPQSLVLQPAPRGVTSVAEELCLPWAAAVRLRQQQRVVELCRGKPQHCRSLVALERGGRIPVAGRAFLERDAKRVPAKFHVCCFSTAIKATTPNAAALRAARRTLLPRKKHQRSS